jgi:YidC/Oxa1 family membrane protein insertase
MLWLLKVFYRMFGNWGIAIILLTVVVKLLTLYWTQKSMRSMKQMQRLKPKIDELRAKFKDDKERLNQEMMALYKIHKVNPLGGCLPMLIQMPIWFALYRTLGNAVELYRSNFAGWITDLTAPDPYYVLPIAMGISMYAQQAITPQPMEGTQAKMMKYFMPGFFTLMMLALPSGLTLYIFVNTVLTMIHQWYMNKTEPAEPVAKSPPAKATVGGSGSSEAGQRGGQRPRRRKKRKGRG